MKKDGMYTSTVGLEGYGKQFHLQHEQVDALSSETIGNLFDEWIASLGDGAFRNLGLVKSEMDTMTPNERQAHIRGANLDAFIDWLCEHKGYGRIQYVTHTMLAPNVSKWLATQYAGTNTVVAELRGIWSQGAAGVVLLIFSADVIESDSWGGEVSFNLMVTRDSVELFSFDWHDGDLNEREYTAICEFQFAFGPKARWSKEDLDQIMVYAYDKGFEHVRKALDNNTLDAQYRTLRIFNAEPASPY